MKSSQLILSDISKDVVKYKNNPEQPLTLQTGEIVEKLFPLSRATDSNPQQDAARGIFRAWNDLNLDRATQQFENASADVKRTVDEILFINFACEYINNNPTEFPKKEVKDLSVALNLFVQNVTGSGIELIRKGRIDRVRDQCSEALQKEAKRETGNDFNKRLRLLLYAELLDSLDLSEYDQQKLAGAFLLLPAIHNIVDLGAIHIPANNQETVVDNDDSKSNAENESTNSSMPSLQQVQNNKPTTVAQRRQLPSLILNAANRNVKPKKSTTKPKTTTAINREDKQISNQLTMLIFTMMQ
jgi:hypothetical protein